jgi:hypothetical protein
VVIRLYEGEVINHRSDIYSLGSLCAIVSRQTPFYRPSGILLKHTEIPKLFLLLCAERISGMLRQIIQNRLRRREISAYSMNELLGLCGIFRLRFFVRKDDAGNESDEYGKTEMSIRITRMIFHVERGFQRLRSRDPAFIVKCQRAFI